MLHFNKKILKENHRSIMKKLIEYNKSVEEKLKVKVDEVKKMIKRISQF